jgi:prefoldin subunit 5
MGELYDRVRAEKEAALAADVHQQTVEELKSRFATLKAQLEEVGQELADLEPENELASEPAADAESTETVTE